MNIPSGPNLQAQAVTAMGEVEQVAKTNDEFLREAAARIRQRMARTAKDIVEIGRELIAVRDRVGRGNFLPWIAREFGMSDQTAYRFIHVAKNMADQIPHGVEFPPAVLYALAAPSTPEEVRTEITERAAAGETVTLADVQSSVEAAKNANAAVKADADRAELTSKQQASVHDLLEKIDTFSARWRHKNAPAARAGRPSTSRSAKKPQPSKSEAQRALAEFKYVVNVRFPQMDDDARREAVEYVIAYSKTVQPKETQS
jgi:hypothetical protein